MTSNNLKLTILFQMFTRLLTFAMNNLITRYTSASQLGLISGKLDLVGNTILALARDGVRLAVLRAKGKGAAWVAAPLTVVIGAVCTSIALKYTTEPALLPFFSQYRLAVLSYYLAAILESLTEPSAVDLIMKQEMKKKVLIESMALIFRIATVLGGILNEKNLEIDVLMKAFSRGQVVYAISLNLFYLFFEKTTILSSTWPSKESLSLTWSMTRQNFFKYFLAQGDMFIISYFSANLSDQGVYTVVSNYGSLVLRMLMQPIEEASLQYFTREKNKKALVEYFNLMLKTMIYLGLIFICYASFFTDPVILILLGRKWMSDKTALNALSAYCYLVAAAGVSGFIESLVNVVIEETWMAWQRMIAMTCSAVYCAVAVMMIKAKGSVGLIVAGFMNFSVRALTNAFILQKYGEKESLNIWQDGINISPCILVVFIMAYVINIAMFLLYRSNLILRISVAVALLAINATLLIKKDKKFVDRFISHWIK
jgi:oligosaccharide translocation protein RFT1